MQAPNGVRLMASSVSGIAGGWTRDRESGSRRLNLARRARRQRRVFGVWVGCAVGKGARYRPDSLQPDRVWPLAQHCEVRASQLLGGLTPDIPIRPIGGTAVAITCRGRPHAADRNSRHMVCARSLYGCPVRCVQDSLMRSGGTAAGNGRIRTGRSCSPEIHRVRGLSGLIICRVAATFPI